MNKLKLKELNNLTHSLEEQRLLLEESYYPLLLSYFNLSSLSELIYLLSIICPNFRTYRVMGGMIKSVKDRQSRDMLGNIVSLEQQEILRLSFTSLINSNLSSRIAKVLSPYKESIEKREESSLYKRHYKHCLSTIYTESKAWALFNYLTKYPQIFFSYKLEKALVIIVRKETDPVELDRTLLIRSRRIENYFSHYPEIMTQLSLFKAQWESTGIKLPYYSNPNYGDTEAAA